MIIISKRDFSFRLAGRRMVFQEKPQDKMEVKSGKLDGKEKVEKLYKDKEVMLNLGVQVYKKLENKQKFLVKEILKKTEADENVDKKYFDLEFNSDFEKGLDPQGKDLYGKMKNNNNMLRILAEKLNQLRSETVVFNSADQVAFLPPIPKNRSGQAFDSLIEIDKQTPALNQGDDEVLKEFNVIIGEYAPRVGIYGVDKELMKIKQALVKQKVDRMTTERKPVYGPDDWNK